ncbi:hypothetical protein LZ199_01815 [Myxococcus sp. QH3KD-4-1]|nr:hypothetical protein [Myxococcus qinghaiensis]
MRLILLALCLLVAGSARAADAEFLARLDALHAGRADAAAVKELEAEFKKALAATPDDFEVLWRQARLLQWQADGAGSEKLKKVLGRQTWDVAERALKLAPARVEGHYYAATGIGAYSQAVGVVKALGEGLEGKFNERADAAIKIDPAFNWSAPLLVKGRYFYELPWPKRDLKKSAEYYEKAIKKNPEMLRAHYFLAETLLKDDKAKEARDAIQKVKQGSTAYDPPEGQRIQEWAKKVEADIEEELK